MRIKFEYEPFKESIKLPINYNRYLQEMLYAMVSEKLEGFQPDRGEAFKKKHFSLFNFSKIFGDFEIVKEINNQKNLVFKSSISFFVSAPYEELLGEFVRRVAPRSVIQLGRGELCLSSLTTLPAPAFDKPVTLIRSLSPIAIRDSKQENKRSSKQEYLSPEHPGFSAQIRTNLLEKYLSCMGFSPKERDLTITPHYFSPKKNSHVIKFKDYSIKGYSGIYKLSGSKELKTFAYDCGLGERNAQGFGMFDIYKEREKTITENTDKHRKKG
ncbi:MAG: CRISPR-associated endoribonuclease Cas6 [bacterium]|nr:CRISPR-associated endoribonuclease Cas6 [bacterium]